MSRDHLHDDDQLALSSIEEILEDARNGRMFILVDAEDRENEGDLVIPARFATPDAINFMAKHGRGLICLSVTKERAEQLKLPLMSDENRTRHQTAFTVSIEAKEGVSTGISAHDRARTIAVATDPGMDADDIVTPGHVFPLVAKDGGVLTRAGHTEAAVDIARISGAGASGVICEIMNDDGTMARLPDLIAFAQLHGLKVGTIADLIAFRQRNDRFIERRLEVPFTSRWGRDFRMLIYRNVLDGAEHVALVKGAPKPGQPTLVRMHKVDFAADVMGESSDRGAIVEGAMQQIAEEPDGGVIIFIRETHANAITERFGAKPLPKADDRESRALKEYGVGAQILLDIGVTDMTLLTNGPAKKVIGLEGYGLRIVGARAIITDVKGGADV